MVIRMIIDNINSSEKYNNMHKDFEKVFDYLKKLDPTTIGRVDLSDTVWVTTSLTPDSESNTKPFEAHRNYLDIHYIVSGKETFGYSNTDRLTSIQEYNELEDFELLEGEISTIILNEGDFCIIYPEDSHIPFMKKLSDHLVRAVAKIKYI